MVCAIATQASAVDSSPQVAGPIKIIPRTAWTKKDRDTSKFKKHSAPINQIVLHHSGAAVHLNGDPRTRINNSIRSWHMEAKGKWGDVAYHYLLDKEGNIYEGRPQNVRGRSFTKYNLDRKLLICVLGDYRTEKEKVSALENTLKRKLTKKEISKIKSEFQKYGNELSKSTQKSLVNLIATKANELKLSIDDIKTHREITNSSCPGNNYQKWFEKKGKKQIEGQLKK